MTRERSSGYTEQTRQWLEERFRVEEGAVYRAHQPIYGIGEHEAFSEPDHLWRAAKTVQLMRALARMDVRSMLDLGAAEGYTSELARRLFNLDVTVADVSLEAMLRARDLFDLPGASVNASNLPFRDDAFDVVLCAECIEHLERPFEMILEAARVARRCLVISTVESRASYLAARLQLYRLPIGEPHGHRSVWCRQDFARMLGPGIETTTQNVELPWTRSATAMETLRANAIPPPPPYLGEGIVMVCWLDPAAKRPTPRLSDDEVLRRVLEFHVDLRPARAWPDDHPVPPGLRDALQCPVCRSGSLAPSSSALACNRCHKEYRAKGGVPDLFVAEPADLEVLVRLPKPVDAPAPRVRLRWARARTAQFDREPRVRSGAARWRLLRVIRFLERLDAEPGWRGKLAFLARKGWPFGARRE